MLQLKYQNAQIHENIWRIQKVVEFCHKTQHQQHIPASSLMVFQYCNTLYIPDLNKIKVKINSYWNKTSFYFKSWPEFNKPTAISYVILMRWTFCPLLFVCVCCTTSVHISVLRSICISVSDLAGTVPQPGAQQTEHSSGANQSPSQPAVKGRGGAKWAKHKKSFTRF